MRVLPIVLLVLWVWSAAVAENAAAQEDTATLWAALRAGGHVALVRHSRMRAEPVIPPGSGSTTARPNAISLTKAAPRPVGSASSFAVRTLPLASSCVRHGARGRAR